MTLALSGNSLLAVGGSLATGCCCGDPDDAGYWWCVNGKCLQSELAPDAIYAGRYLTQEACERRCLDVRPDRCGCCSYPNPLTGLCEPCEEACTKPDGSDCDTDCEAANPESIECQCDKHTHCTNSAECGCCMQCVDHDESGQGRCVPCPDDTICVDSDETGTRCDCVPLELCAKFPLLCPEKRRPPGINYACTRNSCGEPDCKLVRGGKYLYRWQCLLACRDAQQESCGIAEIGRSSGSLGDVQWSDTHYAIQAAKSKVCLRYRAATAGTFRVLIKSPVLDRDCRVIATDVVQRDSNWSQVRGVCPECDKADVSDDPDPMCVEADPSKPYCCGDKCQAVPCPCKRCKKARTDCRRDKDGTLTWTKPRGVTSFTVRVLRDRKCRHPEPLCIKLGCPKCPSFAKDECADNDPPGQCCLPDYTCIGTTKCKCEKLNGKFAETDRPCIDPYACCKDATCGVNGLCPAPCCCPDGGGACRRTCDYPPCCTSAGCVEEVPASLCIAIGGVPKIGKSTCGPGLCCPSTGANDCPAGYTCCGDAPPYVCCENTKCCINGACVAPDAAACPACQVRVGPKCNKQCRPCDQLGMICCNGVCHAPPCPCPQGQFSCGNTCCPNGQFCVNGQCSPCPAGKIVCGNNCCNPDQFCVNGQCRQCETIPCTENPNCEACKGIIGPTCSACDMNIAQQQCAGLQAACAQLGGTFFQGQSEWNGETIPVCMCLNACLGYDKTAEQCTALSNNYWQFGGAFFSLLANGCQPDGCCPPCEGA